MAERTRTKIGLREVRGLQPGQQLWDTTCRGFHIRRQKDAVSYILFYRTKAGRQRWHVIGRHGAPWTPDMARVEAMRLLGEVAAGEDPSAVKKAAKEVVTMADLCDQYWSAVTTGGLLTRSGRAKKASTLESDRGRIQRHIKPLLGGLAVGAVTRSDVNDFMHKVARGETAARVKTDKKRGLSNVRGGRGVATRTMGLLGAIFAFAIEQGLCSDNPVRGVRKFATNRKERRLSDAEYAALGRALIAAEANATWRPAIGVIRFLALTGWRSGEALGLRQGDVDLGRRTVTLPDSKTGRSMRPLSHGACELLAAQERIGDGELVFPPSRGSGTMSGFRSLWNKIMKLGGLPADVTPHVLRHSFASLAADLGYSEPTIAALIGHAGQSITSRYVHSADAVLLAAADAVAKRTAELMGEVPTRGEVVPLRAGG